MFFIYIIIFLFIELLVLIQTNDSITCNSDNILFKPKDGLKDLIKGDILDYYSSQLKEEFLKFVYTMYDKGENIDDYLYDIIESIDQECFDFVLKFFFHEREFLFEISEKILHDGGIIQNSISSEEDCVNEKDVYLLFTGENNSSYLRDEGTYQSKEALFRESINIRQEICIFKECRHIYKSLLEYLLTYHKDKIKGLLKWNNIKLTGINYQDITEEEKVQKTEEEKQKENIEKQYFQIIKYIISIIYGFVFICTIISCIINNKGNKYTGNKEEKKIIIKSLKDKVQDIENKISLNNTQKLIEEEEDNINKIQKKKLSIGIKLKRFISSFDLIYNLSLLKETKEPLSDQTDLIALSTIKLIILFLIMVGENGFMILKYIENKMSILPFCKGDFFFTIKIGINSYESYKVICGIILGYKLIGYYYNNEKKLFCGNLLRFYFKQFPYIIIFLIIHYFLNYPKFIYVKKYFGNQRNDYFSSIMGQYYCEKNTYNIFFVTSILQKYNSTDFNIGQFNGCFWPNLFVLAELICFFFVFIVALVNIFCSKCRYINLIYSIFLICNLIWLVFYPLFTQEFRDLIGGYTISRLFGLSGAIAKPDLFFPLYYIGFNLGIIYYYHLKYEKPEKSKNFNYSNIPFGYCYHISKWVYVIKDSWKYIIMLIIFALIILISFSFTFLIRSINEDTIFFTFEEMKISKYIFVYESILNGILFSFFMLFYLCLPTDSFIKICLSSEIFNFVNKISFVFFITFGPILNIFHSVGVMELYLYAFLIYTNTVILFVITCLFSIFLSCSLFFPIKWIYLYITEGFDSEKLTEIHLFK